MLHRLASITDARLRDRQAQEVFQVRPDLFVKLRVFLSEAGQRLGRVKVCTPDTQADHQSADSFDDRYVVTSFGYRLVRPALEDTLVGVDQLADLFASLHALADQRLVQHLLALGKLSSLHVAVLQRLDRLLTGAGSSPTVGSDVDVPGRSAVDDLLSGVRHRLHHHPASATVVQQELQFASHDLLTDLVVDRSVDVLLLHHRVHQVRVLVQ